MKRKDRVEVLALGGLLLVAQATWAGDLQVGIRVEDLRLLKCRQRGGVKPGYDHYRLSGLRYCLVGVWKRGPLRVGLEAGFADLTTHSSEGETVEFDPEPLWGFFVSHEWPVGNAGTTAARLGAAYAHYAPEQEDVTATPKDAATTGGDLSVDWTEVKVWAELVRRWSSVELSVGPVWQDVTIDQDRVYPDRTVSSSFDPETEVGLVSRLRWAPYPQLTADLWVEAVHRAAFSLGITYRF
ncbi:MAG TPA: hypothetical protein EYP62_03625 [Kiritimatiellae bacterium]|nr:hypothetical protein [Kiritimatiellia bacterium]